MQLKSRNAGLLAVSDVTPAMKVVVMDEAKQNDKGFRNVKVRLPDGTEKLGTILGMSDDLIAEKWGDESLDWIGRTFECVVKTSKAGNEYIVLVPTDDERDMSVVSSADKPLSDEEKATLQAAREREGGKTGDEPLKDANGSEIPF